MVVMIAVRALQGAARVEGLAQFARISTHIPIHPVAGPSRCRYSTSGPSIPSRKGKERQLGRHVPREHVSILPVHLSRPRHRVASQTSRSSNHLIGRARHFHTTARRDAIPLIPATIGILKSTSILTLVTTISRILISFFPIGTLATFRFARGVSWVSNDARRPESCGPSEEFFKLWCADERGVRPTRSEARDILLQGKPLPNGGVLGPDGQVSYAIPMPPSRWKDPRDNYEDPTAIPRTTDTGRDRTSWIIKLVHRTRFFLPPLPAAAVPYYDRLSPEEKGRVDALRRYWISVRTFKDSLRTSRWVLGLLFFLPIGMVFSVYLAGLERVPLTGRWRIILLTPEEEDAIALSLAGSNWYRSVIHLLTTPDKPAPPIVPIEDWRWRWVQGVLTRLETGVLAECHGRPSPYDPAAVTVPPASYPLKPRPRVSCRLHSALPGGESNVGQEHLDIGPPYSLIIMDKDEKNAFSYGFGGKGAGGIVVYTGLLDEILREPTSTPTSALTDSRQPTAPTGFFGGLFASGPTQRRPSAPTEAQTLHLASVLAHEMGHLLLSHHLETLSQQQVLWPSMLGLSVDLARAFIWPLTLFLGPTVNDALANMGRTSSEGLSERYGHIGFQWKHEYEADLAGLRILGLAGFNPHASVEHFASSVADLREIQSVDDHEEGLTGRLFKLWTTATHPTPEQRVEAIRAELKRWSLAGGGPSSP